MKNLITTITFAFFFFLFSCAGTDKINNELIEEIDEQQALLELTDETDSQIEMVVEIEIDMETEYEQTEPIEIIPDETLVQPLEEPVQPIVQEQQPVQPIVQEQQPVQPIVQEQPEVQPLRQEEPQEEPSALPLLPPDLLAADAADRNDTVRETLHIEPWRDFPSAPATRIESPNQMGLVPQNNDIVFFLLLRVTVGQILEIPFRGNGWVFLGELASRRGIAYNSRRNDPEGMSFIFHVEQAGTFVLRFFREDFTRGYILNDHVQVIAGEAPAAATGWFNPQTDRGRIVAEPRWPSATEEALRLRELDGTGTQPLPPQQQETLETVRPIPETVPPSTAEILPPVDAAIIPPEIADTTTLPEAVIERQETIPPEMLLQRAREAFDAGNVTAAITLLDQYMLHYPGGSDEAFWLYGQFYEANSPSRNILLSLSYYRRLVDEYPQSSRLTDARRRIAHIERFFIHIQ